MSLTQTKRLSVWEDAQRTCVIFIDQDGEQSRQIKPWLDLQLNEQYFPIEGTLSSEEFWARQRVEEGLYKFLDIYCAWVAQSYENYVNMMNSSNKNSILINKNS
jgi:hypothetical protein